MTIYKCKVAGCNSNSKINNDLQFFVLPKDVELAKVWLKATRQSDHLVAVSNIISSRWGDNFRVCSLHFLPTNIRNRRLAEDAIPRLNLPNKIQGQGEVQDPKEVTCVVCCSIITGYRYKCTVCEEYDLCKKCQRFEDHLENHYLIRFIDPVTPSEAKRVVQNFNSMQPSNTIEHKHQNKTLSFDSDSDDEPITKYQKNNTVTLELSNADRNKITNEVNRVLKLLNKKRKSVESDNKVKLVVKKVKKNMCTISTQTPVESDSSSESAHEVEFADVNDFKNEKPGEGTLDEDSEEIKTEMDSMLYTMLT